MIEKIEFLRIFDELGDIHNDDIAVEIDNQVSVCGNPHVVASIYDIRERHGFMAIAEFNYPFDCINRSPVDLVNKIYRELDLHFHMDMKKKARDIFNSRTSRYYLQQLIQPIYKEEIIKSMEKAIKSMEKALKYEPGIIQDTYDRLCGPATTNIYFNPGRTNNKLNLDLSYFCSFDIPKWKSYVYKIDRVIFNDPATIILWKSGEKTVVKCGPNETFDKEKGLAMALCKYFLGNKGNFNEFFKKFMKEEK